MDTKTAATLLATLAVVGLFFIGYVIRLQIPLIEVKDTSLNKRIRYMLFFIAIIIFIGTVVLLGIDVLTIFTGLKRSENHINITGIVYTFTIAIELLLSSVGWWVIYWSIGKEDEVATKLATKNESDRVVLQGKNDVLQADNDKLNARK